MKKTFVKIVFSLVSAVFAVILVGIVLYPDKTLNLMQGVLWSDGISRILKSDNPFERQDYDGIDVSHHQGKIDWHRVAADTCVKFVYIKATEGIDFRDENYTYNFNGAVRSGIAAGSYHFLTSSSSIVGQFRNFISVANKNKQLLIPMIDIEESGVNGWNGQQIADSLHLFSQLLQNYYGVRPLIYTYSQFFRRYLQKQFADYPLFLAHYSPTGPQLIGKTRFLLWQHSSQGIVDGISKSVDLDVFANDYGLKDILYNGKGQKEK